MVLEDHKVQNVNGVMHHGSFALPTAPSTDRPSRRQPFIIGVAGGSASGKSRVCNEITQRLHDSCLATLNQDSFYKPLTHEQLQNKAAVNFDEPAAIDVDAMVSCLACLRRMEAVEVPTYDYNMCAHKETKRIPPADVVLVEGALVLYFEQLRPLLNLKLFVEADDDTRLARRIQRDCTIRGRVVTDVIQQYTSTVKPAFDTYVAPSRRFADIIIPFGRGDNLVAVDLITEHIRGRLREPELKALYPNLEVIPSNFQTRGMHTIVRDQHTSKSDFTFFADRLLRLVVEAGLGHLPFEEKVVVTPPGYRYVGVDYAKKLCGVSIIRSGESMENALRDCCKGIKIGKVLVHRERGLLQTSSNMEAIRIQPIGSADDLSPLHRGSGEGGSCGENAGGALDPSLQPSAASKSACTVPSEVIYERLPADIAERYVLLLDPVLSTGYSAERAIKVLLNKGVDENKILFLTLVAAPEGIHRICSQFPTLKLITSEIDATTDEGYQVVPGVGQFADRYFCE